MATPTLQSSLQIKTLKYVTSYACNLLVIIYGGFIQLMPIMECGDFFFCLQNSLRKKSFPRTNDAIIM